MNNQEKHAHIVSGNHLLTIISRFPPMPPWQKTIVYGLCYALGFLLIFCSVYLWSKSIMPLWFGLLGVVASVAFMVLSRFIVAGSEERKNPLIISEVGVTIGPQHCANWDEIKSWRFHGYYGIERLSFSRVGEGTTICIDTTDWRNQFYSNKGHSVLGLQGYFLNENEQASWRQICTEKGVQEEKNV